MSDVLSNVLTMDLLIAIIKSGIVLFAVLLLKFALDLEIARTSVKYLSWVPFRSIFRIRSKDVSGEWDQLWSLAPDLVSSPFEKDLDRHSNSTIRQLGPYIYAEFVSKRRRYCVFGRIEGSFIYGSWCDLADPSGYFGTFELIATDQDRMKGYWLGHSKEVYEIKHGSWVWNRIRVR